MSWKVGGEKYLPMLAAAEVRHGIPTELLARIAFQECSWRPAVIEGRIRSKPGAVGLMQLLPKFFPGAGITPQHDVEVAATFLASLHARFGDWQVAVAAYNWGGGSVHHEYVVDHSKYVLADMPVETRNYVSHVFHDVPIPGALVPISAVTDNTTPAIGL